MTKKLLFIILDGFGISEKVEGNAIRAANPEFLAKIFGERPFTQLAAGGAAVGLPASLPGNSEVGHLNIGAGRTVFQDSTRIDAAIADGSFQENQTLIDFFRRTLDTGGAIHMLGMITDGGGSSNVSHILSLLGMAKKHGLDRVFIHPFTDGRDSTPTSGVHVISDLLEKISRIGIGKIASISGRFYATDCNQRWERTEKTYLALVHGVGNRASSPVTAIEASYRMNLTDEFIVPVVFEAGGNPVGTINEGDSILFFDVRADRVRQLAAALSSPDFSHFKTRPLALSFASLTRISDSMAFPLAFPPVALRNVLGEVLGSNEIPHFRVSEAEKSASITTFLNGGTDLPFPLEERQIVPSAKVRTYDQKPECAAFEVTDALIEKIRSLRYPFLLANFANCDLVGHTGIIDATVKAVQTVDSVVSKVVPIAFELGYDCLIAGDHGNAEQMLDPKTGDPFPGDTANPVPCCLISRDPFDLKKDGGRLASLAPTILELLGLPVPAEMDGGSLLVRKR